jgi:hypothetical protein
VQLQQGTCTFTGTPAAATLSTAIASYWCYVLCRLHASSQVMVMAGCRVRVAGSSHKNRLHSCLQDNWHHRSRHTCHIKGLTACALGACCKHTDQACCHQGLWSGWCGMFRGHPLQPYPPEHFCCARSQRRPVYRHVLHWSRATSYTHLVYARRRIRVKQRGPAAEAGPPAAPGCQKPLQKPPAQTQITTSNSRSGISGSGSEKQLPAVGGIKAAVKCH